MKEQSRRCNRTHYGFRGWKVWPGVAAIAMACARELAVAESSRFCEIQVVDKANSWPVPLVELVTTHQLRFVTDNAGVVAFDAPELMGRETWFDVKGHGYEVPKDGFGYAGVRLTPEPGKKLRITVERKIVARRLGRVTGGGIFAECQKLGRELDWVESGILGCDSVQNTIHNGKYYWVWGDTTLGKYPLGIFHGTGATTPVQPLNSFEPPLRLKLHYILDEKGTPRAVASVPGSGPTWLSGFVSLPDVEGNQRLVASYAKITPPLEAYEWSLAAWNETLQQFERLKVVWTKESGKPRPTLPEGHVNVWQDPNGKAWALFGNPFPQMKCPATFEAWQNPATWETIKPPEKLDGLDGGRRVKVTPHSGSIAWLEARRCWGAVFMEAFGKPSAFGELWYTEADSPLGPWRTAVKVVSHNDYTFYNPRLHPAFSTGQTNLVFFEGTYTREFSGNKNPTPRYDYNQVLYRLDLDDVRLKPVQGKR